MFLLSETASADLAETVTETVSKNVNIWSFDMIRDYFVNGFPTVFDFLVKLVIAIIVLLVGRQIIKFIKKILKKTLDRTSIDAGLSQFLVRLANAGMYFVLIMSILGKFGVTTSSVIAIIGSVGLSVGLALQGSLSNFAGGVLILLMRPFVIGDYIKEDIHGNEGTVTQIQLFYTKLTTVDNKTVVLPNGNLSNCSLVNYTHQGKRKIELQVGISYDADLKKAKEVLLSILKSDEKILQEDEPLVFVSELADSAVMIGSRSWVLSEDYWPTRWRIIEEVKLAFDEAGIVIPFNQMDVMVHQVSE